MKKHMRINLKAVWSGIAREQQAITVYRHPDQPTHIAHIATRKGGVFLKVDADFCSKVGLDNQACQTLSAAIRKDKSDN